MQILGYLLMQMIIEYTRAEGLKTIEAGEGSFAFGFCRTAVDTPHASTR
jgi:hypothetical protein